MAKTTSPLLPPSAELLRQFGDRLRVARLRRRLTAKQVAERAGMAPMTLRSLERGGAGVTIGAYLGVMQVLGIEKDLDLLAKADTLGRELQDARLSARSKAGTRNPPQTPASTSRQKRSSPAKMPDRPQTISHEKLRQVLDSLQPQQLRAAISTLSSEQLHDALRRLEMPAEEIEKPIESWEHAPQWIEKSGFASSRSLADLIEPAASPPNKRR